jgi:hypothetical protein
MESPVTDVKTGLRRPLSFTLAIRHGLPGRKRLPRWDLQDATGAGIWDANLCHMTGRMRMSGFDDREKAFESKFALDADMQFRAEARRNKLVGLWAAGLLGKSGDEAATYAMTVVQADFEESGTEDVVRKVAGDLAGLASADDVRAKLKELLPVAKAQLMDEV